MESKQCIKCKKTLLLEAEFKTSKRTGQYTKWCIRCLDMNNKYIEKNECIRGKQKAQCRECDGAFCKHNIQKTICRDPSCGGGGAFCKHGKRRILCRDPICEGGGAFCKPHGIRKNHCKICNPIGHFAQCVRSRIHHALGSDKEFSSQDYIGCTFEIFKQHIEAQFKEGITWLNYGEWHIDHKIPLAYKQDGIR